MLQKEGRIEIGLPSYTVGEEIVNASTHGLGIIFGIVSFIFLLKRCHTNLQSVFCFSVYGGALIVLYLFSTLYHALTVSRAKLVFRRLDHCAIFLMIAATYTPLGALLVGGKLGVGVVLGVWVVALFGIILNAIDVNRFAKFSFVCYIAMSWCILFIIKPLIRNLTAWQVFWLFGGGAMYTIGAVFYVLGKKIRYAHGVWHLFVLLGSASHFAIFC
ncbi:MAG: hemolysin III family protein [Oscillospiraceae bacterium]|jgi:hemolysin III|nr:hemolysin III family protein [Oscillospiraceae bacterium]